MPQDRDRKVGEESDELEGQDTADDAGVEEFEEDEDLEEEDEEVEEEQEPGA